MTEPTDGAHGAPTQFPTEDVVTSEPLETEDGTVVIRQHSQGPANIGHGEFPDPDTPAWGPAPGADRPTGHVPHDDRSQPTAGGVGEAP